jgi:hypothetical protein
VHTKLLSYIQTTYHTNLNQNIQEITSTNIDYAKENIPTELIIENYKAINSEHASEAAHNTVPV